MKVQYSDYQGGTLNNYQYTVFFEPLPGGRFDVIVPVIPEIYAFGETIEEDRETAKEAIHHYLESAIKHGVAMPEDPTPAKEQVVVSL